MRKYFVYLATIALSVSLCAALSASRTDPGAQWDKLRAESVTLLDKILDGDIAPEKWQRWEEIKLYLPTGYRLEERKLIDRVRRAFSREGEVTPETISTLDRIIKSLDPKKAEIIKKQRAAAEEYRKGKKIPTPPITKPKPPRPPVKHPKLPAKKPVFGPKPPITKQKPPRPTQEFRAVNVQGYTEKVKKMDKTSLQNLHHGLLFAKKAAKDAKNEKRAADLDKRLKIVVERMKKDGIAPLLPTAPKPPKEKPPLLKIPLSKAKIKAMSNEELTNNIINTLDRYITLEAGGTATIDQLNKIQQDLSELKKEGETRKDFKPIMPQYILDYTKQKMVAESFEEAEEESWSTPEKVTPKPEEPGKKPGDQKPEPPTTKPEEEPEKPKQEAQTLIKLMVEQLNKDAAKIAKFTKEMYGDEPDEPDEPEWKPEE